jgi:NAD(P)-dependent dehydrogenase (short-subunit alcohol dehydrogenase family)
MPNSDQAMKLKDKVALITGGARGIGKAVALAYAREGARLALCSRTEPEIDKTVRELQAFKTEAKGWVCDVSAEDSVRDLIQDVDKFYGRIDVLVNNAGVMTRPTPVVEFDVKKWDYTIAVNLRGPFLLTREVLPVMIRHKSGSIINVSSGLGRMGYANFSAYSVSKWGLEGFTQVLCTELRSSHIRVNSVDPGYVATKLTHHQGKDPDSVTEVFVFLASEESRGITGKMLSSSRWKQEIEKNRE